MMYVDFTADNKDYKLRLNTRTVITLEKQLGCNPLAIFGDGAGVPTVTQMVNILYCALQPLNHGISLDNAYDIFDAYIADGNSAIDFISVILDIYRVSGLIKGEGATEKN